MNIDRINELARKSEDGRTDFGGKKKNSRSFGRSILRQSR